jgi:hypothetical protein
VFKIQDAELRASMRALDEFESAKRAAAIEAAAADGGEDRPGTVHFSLIWQSGFDLDVMRQYCCCGVLEAIFKSVACFAAR